MSATSVRDDLRQRLQSFQKRLAANLQAEKQILKNRRFGSTTAPPAPGACLAVPQGTDSGESHRAEPRSPPTASFGYDSGSFHLFKGELYPKKEVPGRQHINCGWSMEQMTAYAVEAAGKLLPHDSQTNFHLPCYSSADYVNTLYETSQSQEQPRFMFANDARRFLTQAAVGINSVSPGFVFGIHNGLEPPEEFIKARLESHCAERVATSQLPDVEKKYAAEEWAAWERGEYDEEHSASFHRKVTEMQNSAEPKYELKEHVREYYHGCDPHVLSRILSEGFRPTLGEGVDDLRACYGVPVPGVYVSNEFDMAQWFPCMPTTGPIKLSAEEEEAEYAGGSLVSTDGAFPLRCVIRVLADSRHYLWRKPKYSAMFRPEDLFITHVYWYAVRPELIHRRHLLCRPYLAGALTPASKEDIKAREIEKTESFPTLMCENDQMRGGPQFTRGHCLYHCRANRLLEELVRSDVFEATDDALLQSLFKDHDSEYCFTITCYQNVPLGERRHPLQTLEHHESKRLVEFQSENFPS